MAKRAELCKKGLHDMAEHAYVRKNGTRHCRKCNTEKSRLRREALNANKPPRPAPRDYKAEQQLGSGPVDCTMTRAEWQRTTGYNPDTGQYDLPPQDVSPVFVAGESEGNH